MNSLPRGTDAGDGEIFDRNWFDVVKFNMTEMSPGYTGIHIRKSGNPCIIVTVKTERLQDKTFDIWRHLHDIAYKRWSNGTAVTEKVCPRCGDPERYYRRVWNQHAFCTTCGATLDRSVK